MFEAVTMRRFRFVILLVALVAAGVSGYEFRILQRARLSASTVESAQSVAAPVFGLANVSFACAETHGFVTEVKVAGESATPSCAPAFTEATTRCPSLFPMLGYGEQIKCASGEAIHCAGGPVQALGLFKDDSFCGDVSDRDMGPPGDSERVGD